MLKIISLALVVTVKVTPIQFKSCGDFNSFVWRSNTTNSPWIEPPTSLKNIVAGQGFNGGNSDWYCNILKSEDCSTHHLDQRCGTDGRTYRNMCDIGQAHCKSGTVNQAHDGPCTVSHTTTMSPQQVIHGSQIILDFQCAALSHNECVNAYNEKICGTDNRTYMNFCEYEKARCTHRNLHVSHLGDCSA